MRATATPEFQVDWPDPAFAQMPWMQDAMHFPLPFVPAGFQLIEKFYERCTRSQPMIINNYIYGTPPDLRLPTEEMMKRGAAAVWTEDFQPRIEAFVKNVREASWDEMEPKALASAAAALPDPAIEMFQLTIDVVTAFMGPSLMLVVWLEEQLGEDGPRLASAILQGRENETSLAGAGLDELASATAAEPEVEEAIRAGRFEALNQTAAGRAFRARLDEYLESYGWRLESWGLLQKPTWAEDPSVPLGLIRRYLEDPARAPGAAIKRSTDQRAAAQAEVESRLAPEQLPVFRQLAEAAQAHVAISEGRARLQLTIMGVLRIPLLALGRKLTDQGILGAPEDVFFLEWTELEDAASSSTPLGDLVARRRAEFQKAETLTAPPFLGPPPDLSQAPMEMQLVLKHFFGLKGSPPATGATIQGIGASSGIVSGTARVLGSVDEGPRLQPGEILVCTTTAPPWTPLFAIAGGVVTDTGGVLCHSAICAREYAIPAVVGTQVATARIPDGARVTIDGSAGTVKIEG